MLQHVFAKDELRPLPGQARSTRLARRAGITGLAAVIGLGSVFMFAPDVQAASAPASFADLAAKVTPAVVNISTTQKVERNGGEMPFGGPQMPFPPGSPFEEFFKHFFEQQSLRESLMNRTALGSGFVIDPSGYVVTNNHVVGKAEQIDVTLADGRKLDAKLVGRDEKTDLALLKVEAGGPLPFVSFGDSDKARVGDWVMAVGNPFGLGGTVTAGIVSARGRDINAGPYDDFLQTDASINRGNSGGPMFNMDGGVIGVNTAIYSPNGGSVGIGFAISSSVAKPVIEQLREHGRVDRGWLGVQIQEVTPELASAFKLKEPKGALVAAVEPSSPADKAGLHQGDVILSANEHQIDRPKDLSRLVAEMNADKTVPLTVWRDGVAQKISVQIGAMPKARVADAGAEPSSPEASRAGALGLALAPITPETRSRFGIDDGVKGVLVASVRPGSPAAERGLRAGDVILKVGDKAVATPREAAKQVHKAHEEGQESVVLLFARRGTSQFVVLPFAKA